MDLFNFSTFLKAYLQMQLYFKVLGVGTWTYEFWGASIQPIQLISFMIKKHSIINKIGLYFSLWPISIW